jgi:hypothetical protein
VSGLLERVAQRFQYFKMSFLHQSELVAPKRYTSTICFPSTTIPVVEHGEHHEIQFM